MSDRFQHMRRKVIPATCPFCDARIARPKPFEPGAATPGSKGGRCECGAVFIFDEAGRGGGDALLDGLTLMCGGDRKRAMGLEASVDYEVERRGYRPRTHSLEPYLKARGAFSQPKLWFFREKLRAVRG